MYTKTQESHWRDAGVAYLGRELGSSAPSEVEGPLLVEASPLEGEGVIAIYAFHADLAGQGAARYFLATGETEPNFYPDYRLDMDDVFNLHVGTRFMLVVGVGQASPVPAEEAGRAAIDAVRPVVDAVAPGEPVEEATIAAAFDVDGARHLVVRCRVAGEPVYVMAGGAPPGFSRGVNLPAPVAYRIHLGRVLRLEAE